MDGHGLKRAFDPAPLIAGLPVLAAFAWLEMQYPPIYRGLLYFWMIQPFRVPFLDLSFVTAGVQCWGQGIDVYAHDPCDLLDRPHNYSPLWLRLSFLPNDAASVVWMGLGLALCFLIALGFLPRADNAKDRAMVVLAMLSPSVAFAVERGNLDLAMFCFAVLAARCLSGPIGSRLLAYAVVLFAGLLKFYPLVMLIALARERPKTACAIGAVVAAVFYGFLTLYRLELPRMAAALPTSFFRGSAWGAKGLPMSVSEQPGIVMIVFAGLAAVSVAGGWWLTNRRAFAAPLDALPAWSDHFAVLGAALVCGCFFAGQSQPYRAIVLFLALPGFFAAARVAGGGGGKALFRGTAILAVVVLWQLPMRRAVAAIFGGGAWPVGGSIANTIAWIVLELAWWWLVTVHLAILIRFLRGVWPGWRLSDLFGASKVAADQ